MKARATNLRPRPVVAAASVLTILISLLVGGIGSATANEVRASNAHCVLDVSLRDSAPQCYRTFDQAQDSAQHHSGARQPSAAAASVVLAVLYNYSNWQASGGTLTLTGSTGCGGGGYWTNNFAGGYNDWANSVETYNGCGIVLWEHANLTGRNTGYLNSSGDLGWANNITSSWQIW